MKNWLMELPEDRRQLVYAAMRWIGGRAGEAEREHNRLRPGYSEVAVGGAHMDSFFKSQVLHKFLDGLRAGQQPGVAARYAKEEGQFCVRKWNEVRRGDVHVHRYIGTVDHHVDLALKEITEAAK